MVKGVDAKATTVVVTGAKGQLGRSFQKIRGEYPAYQFHFLDSKEVDITSPASVGGMVEQYSPDIIINCAAYTAVDRAESEPREAQKVNRDGVALLAEAAKLSDIKLVHISTDYLFSGDSDVPYSESDTPNPKTVYGRTKLEGELALEKSGADSIVVRTSWLYSEFGDNFLKTMLQLAERGSPVRVVADQHGTPTYAEDLARAVMQLIEKGIRGYNIYHFSNSGETTWYGFAKEIFRQADVDVELYAVDSSEYPTDAERPRYSVLSTEKIAGVGIEVPRWEDSLSRCLKQIKEDNNIL